MLTKSRQRRKLRVRAKISGTAERPRVSVFRSNRFMYAQLINDDTQKTLASVNQKQLKSKGSKTDLAQEVGEEIAEKASKMKIKAVVFDRSGYQYHGRVRAIVEGLRKKGIEV